MREARRDEPTETFGHYVLYECLGRGGMATVHRARKTGIEGVAQTVALKRMLPWLSSDGEFVKSFVREARLAAQLRHTNIAQTYDLGKVDSVYYIAMELVPGHDLRELLRHAHNVVGPPPVSVVINLLFQLCDALDYAHTFRDDQGRPLGLVHRDISPANIIVGDDGIAKLVDFGVAKGTTNTLATQSGLLKGKFSYMAPEMLQGQVDARSDLFAVGVVAWEMLTAQPLFAGGDDMEILQRVAGWSPPPASTVNRAVPRELDAWLAMALAKDPRRRFQSAAQMRAGLELVARTPQMRASAPDVAGWLQWAFAQTGPRRPSAPAPSAPITTPRVAPAAADAGPRTSTLAVDEASIEVEIPRHPTAVGVAPAPRPARPSTAPPPWTGGVPQPIGTAPSSAIPAPIVIPPSSAVPLAAGHTIQPAAAAAAAARTMLADQGERQREGSGAHVTQLMAPPQPLQPPTQAMAPLQPMTQPMTQMMMPALPPGAMEVPLVSMAPTISPDAGHVAPTRVMPPPPAPSWAAAPAADAVPNPWREAVPRGTPGPQPVAEPPATPPHWGGAAPSHHPREPRRSRPRTAAPPPRSPAGLVVVVVLCAAAAVGGFFLVQHLM